MTKSEQQKLLAMLHRLLSAVHVLASEAATITTVLDGLAKLNNELVEEINGQEPETGPGTSER